MPDKESGASKADYYAAWRPAVESVTRATRTDLAIPSRLSSRIWIQDGSNSYQAKPWRADVGWAWWLLCQPSPKVMRATHQLLRESSRVAKRREPQRCVAEFTSHVACRPKTMRTHMPQSISGRPPRASSSTPSATLGNQCHVFS